MNISLWSSEDHLKSQTSMPRLCRIHCWYANMMFSLPLFLIMALKKKKKRNKRQTKINPSPFTREETCFRFLQTLKKWQQVAFSPLQVSSDVTKQEPKPQNSFLILVSSTYLNTSFDIYFLWRNNTTETMLINHFHMVISLPQEPELQSNGNTHFSIITE